MNGQNLGLFQFEYDLTFMAFFMDANDRFYARYGGREDHHPESHLSKESLHNTMKAVLALHAKKEVQTSKYEPKGDLVRTPEEIEPMKKMLGKRKAGERCIHCHDVKSAELLQLREEGKFAKELVFSNPSPARVGLLFNKDQ